MERYHTSYHRYQKIVGISMIYTVLSLFIIGSVISPSPVIVVYGLAPATGGSSAIEKCAAISRRSCIAGLAFASTTITGCPSHASTYGALSPPSSSSSSPPPPLTLSKSGQGQPARIEELGAGFDLISPPPLKAVDAIYPNSLLGVWRCRRIVVLVEGDKDQARLAWKVLGGGDSALSDDIFTGRKIEAFYTRFVDPPLPSSSYEYTYEGKTLTGVVVDRAFEMESRLDEKIPPLSKSPDAKNTAQLTTYDDGTPPTLSYRTPRGATVRLTVVQRTAERPTADGFGSDELLRATTAAGGLTPGGLNVVRAVRVRRRWRRAFDGEGKRVVEGLEIVKTYRVLDGVAGEIPTSTTKSQIQLSRPTSTDG